jgi:ribulose 1,5-bisphosphate synthetase/thiazole synthase
MSHSSVDVVVVGAGAAGISGAVALAELGLHVVVLDEQGSPGGQIYRGITLAPLSRRDMLGPDYAHGNELAQALASSSVRYEKGAAVWQVTREHEVSYLREGRLHT